MKKTFSAEFGSLSDKPLSLAPRATLIRQENVSLRTTCNVMWDHRFALWYVNDNNDLFDAPFYLPHNRT